MTNTPITKKIRSLIPYFLLAVAIILTNKAVTELSFFAGIISRIWNIILPFFYGFLLAYVLNIPCATIQRLLGKSTNRFILKRRKQLSIILTFLTFGLIIFSALRLAIPAIYGSLILFIENLPGYYAETLQFVDKLSENQLFGMFINKDSVVSAFQEMLQSFSFENFTTSINSLVAKVSSTVLDTVLALISTVYFMFERDKLKAFSYRFTRAFATPMAFEIIMEFSGRLNKNFKQYIYTQTIDGLIIGTLVTIELYLLRSPYALILGIMLGVLNYIPYFGSIIGSIIAIAVVAFTQDIKIAIIAAIILLVTQQLDGNIIQPRLLGGSFSLSPLLVIISISIGGAFAGVLGMIAAIPIVAVLKDLLESIIVHHEWRKLERGERFEQRE